MAVDYKEAKIYQWMFQGRLILLQRTGKFTEHFLNIIHKYDREAGLFFI